MTSARFARSPWIALFLALGCSDTIEVVTGGGGVGGDPTTSSGGGGAGAGVSTGGTGVGAGGVGGDPTSSGGASMGGSPGTGGSTGDPCADACTFVATCGVPLDTCLSYLDCSNPQGECAANCVNEPGVTCDAVIGALQGAPSELTTCLQACQGGGMGGGGAGGGGVGGGGMGGGGVGGGGMGGGGSAMECQQCAQASCGPEVQQCFAGANCNSWINCAAACQDQACIDDCSAMYPAGTALGACLCSDCLNDGCGYTCD